MTRRHIDTRAGEKIIALQPAIKGSLLDSLMVGALTALFNATEQPPYERIKKNIDDIVRLHPVNMGAISRASVNESEESFQISFGEMIPVIDVVYPNQPNVYQPLYLRFEYDGNSFVFENARIPVLISSEHTGAHFVRRAGDILDPKDESFYESLLMALLITQSFEHPRHKKGLQAAVQSHLGTGLSYGLTRTEITAAQSLLNVIRTIRQSYDWSFMARKMVSNGHIIDISTGLTLK